VTSRSTIRGYPVSAEEQAETAPVFVAVGERYGVRNAHAAIISRRAWNAAQEALAARARGAWPTSANVRARAQSQGSCRKRTALDWMAVAVEENGREIVEVYLAAARKGDWRAAEALMNRIYGKPEAAVVAHVPQNPALPVLKSMRLEEKLELLRRLQGGELADTASALAIVETVPQSR
jgi:hypothetical protein